MALTKEDLQAIGELMDTKLTASEERTNQKLETISQTINELKESVEEIRDSTNYMADWIQKLEDAFNTHRIETK